MAILSVFFSFLAHSARVARSLSWTRTEAKKEEDREERREEIWEEAPVEEKEEEMEEEELV